MDSDEPEPKRRGRPPKAKPVPVAPAPDVSADEEDDVKDPTPAIKKPARPGRAAKTQTSAPAQIDPPKKSVSTKTKKAPATQSSQTITADDEEDDHDVDILPPPAAKASTKSKTKSSAAAQGAPKRNISTKIQVAQSSQAVDLDDEDGDDDDQPRPATTSTKQLVMKGKVPVNEAYQFANNVHVYCEGDEIFDVALNQTCIGQNNNKFYLIQLLEHDARKQYTVFTRWGRVGKDGQNHADDFGADLDQAKRNFTAKFKDKTRNNWEDRDQFVKSPGKYDIVLRDYSVTDAPATKKDVVDSAPLPEVKIPDSTLPSRVQDLMKTIFNLKMMEAQVMEMKYDAKKAPLGRLTDLQVKLGYESLKKIETLLRDGKTSGPELSEACDEYYTKIPHDFGMSRPILLSSLVHLKREVDLLETLADIEIAVRALKKDDLLGDLANPTNPVDNHYRTLNVDIQPIDHDSETFRLINRYLLETQGPTHTDYKLELLDCFDLKKESPFKDVGNRMLLWHGSRLSNFVGILSQGLRIAPPEAPVTGYMFGKGVYFADVSSKSANYCFADSSENVGLMLLCDVALGKPRELESGDYNADKLPPGTFSTKGVGQHEPDPTSYKTLDDGVKVPVGKCVALHASRRGGRSNLSLLYNEYIVYDTKQIRMRYLVQVRFNKKRGRC